jgi:threonine aldolase
VHSSLQAQGVAPILGPDDCTHAIAMHGRTDPAALFAAPDTFGTGAGVVDRYGTGERLNAFEARIAALLGKPAAVFMPSGTMAQQIALRIVADERAQRTFAAHPTTHVVIHEQGGYARLHDLSFVPAGSAVAPLTLADLEAIAEPVGTLLLELPQREIGGVLPAWDELVAMCAYARGRGWHLHLDGARLWESGPFYGRPYAEIAGLFDSVYVSFYKGLGGIAGAMLCGTQSFIDCARVWQRRHGGNLVSLYPYACTAEAAFDLRIDRMAAYRDAAGRLATIVAAAPIAVHVQPVPPATNMFHAYLRIDAAQLIERAQRIAREHDVWMLRAPVATAIDGIVKWEVSAGDATIALGPERARNLLAELLAPVSPVIPSAAP